MKPQQLALLDEPVVEDEDEGALRPGPGSWVPPLLHVAVRRASDAWHEWCAARPGEGKDRLEQELHDAMWQMSASYGEHRYCDAHPLEEA